MDCIFCKIVAEEIPAFKVHEDDATIAFMDINPLTEGHVLVIPKRHVGGVFDTDDETLAALMFTVRKVALDMREGLGLDSMNLLQANGPWAVQSVPHMHFHLIPRREGDGAGMDWPLQPGDMEDIFVLREKIVTAGRLRG